MPFTPYYLPDNRLYLKDDSQRAWLGGYAPGSAHIIENSSVKLDCSQTTLSGSGNTLTINWSLTFKPTFTGTKKAFLFIKDAVTDYYGGSYYTGDNHWREKGSYNIQKDTTP